MVLTSILSIPLGPRVVLTVSAMILAAVILFLWASFPVDRPVPSLRISTGTPPTVCADILPHTSILNLEFTSTRERAFFKVYAIPGSFFVSWKHCEDLRALIPRGWKIVRTSSKERRYQSAIVGCRDALLSWPLTTRWPIC